LVPLHVNVPIVLESDALGFQQFALFQPSGSCSAYGIDYTMAG
jgi:hypothetical protein